MRPLCVFLLTLLICGFAQGQFGPSSRASGPPGPRGPGGVSGNYNGPPGLYGEGPGPNRDKIPGLPGISDSPTRSSCLPGEVFDRRTSRCRKIAID